MKALVRLDDFSPNSRLEGWRQVEAILDRHAIRPLVAVIPNDQYFGATTTTDDFWKEVRRLREKGWAIGLHGDTHLVEPIAPGTVQEIFFASKAEFVGLPFEAQLAKLEAAWREFSNHGVHPIAFVAPNHGFDANTVRALVQQGSMPFLSDGIALRVFRDRGLVWLPQLDWRVPRLRCGFRTICLHPSTIEPAELARLDSGLRAIRSSILAIEDIEVGNITAKGIPEKFFERAFRVFYRLKESLHRLLTPASDGRSA